MTTTDPFELLANGIHDAIHGRECWIPQPDGGTVRVLEHLGLVPGLTWNGLRSLDGGPIRIQSHTGDRYDDDGILARVLVADRSFPVRVTEWQPSDGVHLRRGSIATVYRDEAMVEWEASLRS